MALDRLKADGIIDYELVAWAEFDPESKAPIDKQPAVIAHKALYPQWADRNLGDMTKVDWKQVADFDLLTYSTPCQSISNAGLQKGITEGSGTRSSVLWSTRYAIMEKKPKYLLMENVSALMSDKFMPEFKKWLRELEGYGYYNYYGKLNATDFGVAQNRERVFCVSIRKDIDLMYKFPEPFALDKCLEDYLEEDVDEKFFLSETNILGFLAHNTGYK